MDERRLNSTSLAAQTRGKTKQPQIHRFLAGKTLEPKRSTLEPVARVFGIPIEALFDPQEAARVWAERFGAGSNWTPAQHTATGVGRYPVAQEMSPHRFDDGPTWTLENAMDWNALPEQFVAALPDDALAPDYPRGMLMVWSRAKAPRAGSVVLLRDRHGHPHVREYRPGIDPHEWTASAINRAYPALGPASSAVVAVALYKEMP